MRFMQKMNIGHRSKAIRRPINWALGMAYMLSCQCIYVKAGRWVSRKESGSQSHLHVDPTCAYVQRIGGRYMVMYTVRENEVWHTIIRRMYRFYAQNDYNERLSYVHIHDRLPTQRLSGSLTRPDTVLSLLVLEWLGHSQ